MASMSLAVAVLRRLGHAAVDLLIQCDRTMSFRTKAELIGVRMIYARDPDELGD